MTQSINTTTPAKGLSDRTLHSIVLAVVTITAVCLLTTLPAQYKTIERVDHITDRLISLEQSSHLNHASVEQKLVEQSVRISRLEVQACRQPHPKPVQCK